MKKFYSAVLILINLNCFAQSSKWFVSLSVGASMTGPSASFKHQMVQQGFDQTSTGSFLGFSWTTDYPKITKDAALLLRGGKKINDRRSIYFVAGRSAKGVVEGFRNHGYSDFFGIIGGSYGDQISVSYKAYQLTGGYLYSFPNTKIKLGFGPSVYLLNYKIEDNFTPTSKNTAYVPGASFLARFPFGKEKRLVGTEFFFEGNLAPSAKIKTSKLDGGFQPYNASMTSFNAGLALTFRKK